VSSPTPHTQALEASDGPRTSRQLGRPRFDWARAKQQVQAPKQEQISAGDTNHSSEGAVHFFSPSSEIPLLQIFSFTSHHLLSVSPIPIPPSPISSYIALPSRPNIVIQYSSTSKLPRLDTAHRVFRSRSPPSITMGVFDVGFPLQVLGAILVTRANPPINRISSFPPAFSTVRTPAASKRYREIDSTTGDDVLKLFTYAREKQFAIPACNVTSSRFVRILFLRPLLGTVRVPRACGPVRKQDQTASRERHKPPGRGTNGLVFSDCARRTTQCLHPMVQTTRVELFG
jgi:hypothetical protein